MQQAWPNLFFHMESRDRGKIFFLNSFPMPIKESVSHQLWSFATPVVHSLRWLQHIQKQLDKLMGKKSIKAIKGSWQLYWEIAKLQHQELLACPGEVLCSYPVLPLLGYLCRGKPLRLRQPLLYEVWEGHGWKWLRNPTHANMLAFCSPLKRG